MPQGVSTFIRARAAQAHWLGFVTSLAFQRCVRLRKYDPDQPRDDRGRWTEVGAYDVDVTGSTIVVQRYRSGNPDVDSVTAQLEDILHDTMERVGSGSGPTFGTRVHGVFADAVRESNIPGIGTRGVESSFSAGGLVRYGLDGSVRTDITLRTDLDGTGAVVAIFDLKTGTAVLSPSRADTLRRAASVGSYVPVIELHAVRGTSARGIVSRISTRLDHAD